MSYFRNRRDAGKALARALAQYAGDPDVVILALPRGGVAVAFEIARAIHAPLDVFVVRSLGAPRHDDLAMGAVASGGVRVIEPHVVTHLSISKSVIESTIAHERDELVREERLLRGDRRPVTIKGRTVILVDDGLATGATLRAAVMGIRRQEPKRLVVATPVVASSICDALATLVDEIVCATTPEPFFHAGSRYDDFTPVGHEEVRELLSRSPEDVLGLAGSDYGRRSA